MKTDPPGGRTRPGSNMTEEDDRFGFYGSKAAARAWTWNQVVHGLGLVCIEFQMLETALKMTIGRGLVDPLYGIFEHQTEDSNRLQDLKEFLGRCCAAEGKRNQRGLDFRASIAGKL